MSRVDRPYHVQSVAMMIEHGVRVRTWCTVCDAPFRQVDLDAIVRVRGGDFDLWGKSTHCRLTPGCRGRNRFFHNLRGYYSGMW